MAEKKESTTRKRLTYKEALLRKNATRFEDYIENTTTHGVVRIYRGPSWIRRILWLCVVILVLSGLLYFIVERAIRLNSAQKSTSLDIIQASELSFPAITLCNANPVKDTYLTSRNLTGYFECLVDLLAGNNSDCNQHIPNDLNDLTIKELYVEGGQSAEELFKVCLYNNSECTDVEDFNYVPGIYQFQLCYTINGNGNLIAQNTRQQVSVKLNLNNSAFDANSLTDSELGASVTIHTPGQPPAIESGLQIPAGFVGYISLTYSNQSLLEPRYGSCSRNTRLKYYPTYSVAACHTEVSIDQVLKGCGCVSPSAPPGAISGYPDCTIKDTLCVLLYSDITDANLNVVCPQPCLGGTYDSQLSYSLSSSFRAPSPGQPVSGGSFSDEVGVIVRFSSFSVTQVTENIAYGAGDFVSDIGGQMGLFIGASIVSVCELLVWIIDELKDRVFQVWRWCRCCLPGERPSLQGKTEDTGEISNGKFNNNLKSHNITSKA